MEKVIREQLNFCLILIFQYIYVYEFGLKISDFILRTLIKKGKNNKVFLFSNHTSTIL